MKNVNKFETIHGMKSEAVCRSFFLCFLSSADWKRERNPISAKCVCTHTQPVGNNYINKEARRLELATKEWKREKEKAMK